MIVEIKSALAMIKRKKIQMLLIGIILMLVSTLLSLGFSLMNQSTPFEKMFTRSKAAESVYVFPKDGLDIKKNMGFWKEQKEVEKVVNYHALQAMVEFDYNNKLETVASLITDFQTNPNIDQLYINETDRVKAPKGNEVILNYNFAKGYKLKIGDKVAFRYQKQRYELVVSQLVVDPHFSNAFMTDDRFFVAPDFLEKNNINYDTEILGIKYAHYQAEVEKRLNAKYKEYTAKQVSPMFVGYTQFKFSYSVVYGIVAGLLIMVSFFIFIIVAFVIRNTIGNVILQQYKSIGVKKVIGYTMRQIRGSFLWTYGLLSLVTSILGVAISIPIRSIISKGMNYDLQVNTKTSLDYTSLLTMILIIILVLLFTLLATKRANRVKPVQAIKYGMPEGKISKNTFRISHHPRLPLTFLLAIKQLFMNKRKTISTIIMMTIIVFTALLISNTGYTLSDHDHFIKYLTGVRVGDYSISNSSSDKVTNVLEKLQGMKETQHAVFANPEMNESTSGLDSKPVSVGGYAYYGNVPKDFFQVSEGRAPSDKEIVISTTLSELTGKEPGDYITIQTLKADETYLISGLYNTVMFNSVAYVRFEKEVPQNITQGNGFYWVYSDKNNVMMEDVNTQIKTILSSSANATKYDSNTSGIIGTVEPFPPMVKLLMIVFLIVCGIIVLNSTIMDINQMTRAYGIFKAVGFTRKNITQILIIRATIITLIGVTVGFLLNLLTMNAIMQGIFKITPFSTIELPVLFDSYSNLVLIGLFLIVTWIATLLPSRRLSKISAKNLISE